jgi:hypothetical protein
MSLNPPPDSVTTATVIEWLVKYAPLANWLLLVLFVIGLFFWFYRSRVSKHISKLAEEGYDLLSRQVSEQEFEDWNNELRAWDARTREFLGTARLLPMAEAMMYSTIDLQQQPARRREDQPQTIVLQVQPREARQSNFDLAYASQIQIQRLRVNKLRLIAGRWSVMPKAAVEK